MILYPAIDLKEGRCVRLLRGEMSAATVFNEDPAAQAKSFVDVGCRWLHLVDLDGAFAGRPMNAASVEAILKTVRVPTQLGGGIRDLATIEAWLGKGIARVILGTAALTNPDLVKEGCRKFPGKVAVGIDARGGKVAVEGWAKTSEMTALDLARRVEDAGAAAIIFTDIERDGALAGVNVAATAALARALKTPVIASGGVAAIDDIAALKAHESDGIAGAIMGRALYDGRIDLKAALAMVG
ncbi:MAG TPA: 1-(5-phosphoribosyl)-5-[(5-phosphoribosylamino)methylideneamino]imidazole-4-carboxamide isomerase [Stellaceae bacterium]|nr:1-(5-phosphoribosyl)-5-[(5-phosphoribosylamino)methylideneamino]imidazole-4-carboxamide isomerase [Stellaceae bacterium]